VKIKYSLALTSLLFAGNLIANDNYSPTAEIGSVFTKINMDLNITLKRLDAMGHPLTYKITKQPINGKINQENGNIVEYSPSVDFEGLDRIYFIATNDKNTTSNEAIITINVVDSLFPVLEISTLDLKPVTNWGIKFDALIKETNATISSYSWNFGDNSAIETSATPVHSYLDIGDYYIRLDILDSNGFETQDIYPIKIIENHIPVININNNIEVVNGEKIFEPFSLNDKDEHFVIVSIKQTPKNGVISLSDDGNGYTYKSNDSYQGSDNFVIQFDDRHNGVVEENITVTIKQGLAFKEGWNLFALPFDKIIDFTTSEFQSHFNKLTIWKYEGGWKIGDTGNNADKLDTFKKIESYNGYWIKTEKDIAIPILNSTILNNPINWKALKDGWSLLGSMNVSDTRDLMNKNKNLINIWTTDENGIWSTITNDLNDNENIVNLDDINLLKSIKPNKGFWVYAKATNENNNQDENSDNDNPDNDTSNQDCITVGNSMWQDEEKIERLKFQGAKDYCKNLTLCGYSNWELPSKDKLLSIVDKSKTYPAIKDNFKNTKDYPYWSLDLNVKNTNEAVIIDFSDGEISFNSRRNNGYVRCVR